MSRATSRIEGGIEWYGTEGDCQCARCGSSCERIDCGQCGGEGYEDGADIASGYDFGWIDDYAVYRCRHCGGKGGWWHCISSPEWCRDNPMPGREHIESTALKSEAWGDWSA